MPQFYLNMRHGPLLIEDFEGAEYPNLMAARAEALAAAREILNERGKQGKHSDGSRFEIADETGEVLLVLPFHDAVMQ